MDVQDGIPEVVEVPDGTEEAGWPAPPAPATGKKAWMIVAVVGVAIVVAVIGVTAGTHKSSSSSSSSSGTGHWVQDAYDMANDMHDFFTSAAADGNSGGASALQADCSRGVDKIDEWQNVVQEMPVGSTVRSESAAAVADYLASFSACSDGDFSTATTYVKSGNEHLNEATAAVEAMTP